MKRLSSLVGLILAAIACYQLFVPQHGPSVTFGPEEHVYYKGTVTREQAQATGELLQEVGVFTGSKEADVQLVGEGDAKTVRFVLGQPGLAQDPFIHEIFSDMGAQLAEKVFDGAPLQVELCDDALETLTSFPAQKLTLVDMQGNQVYYKNGADQALATKVGELLLETGYFKPQGGNAVRVEKEGELLVVKFVLKEGFWEKRDLDSAWQEIGAALSQTVASGKPIRLELCDDTLKCHHKFDIP